MDERELTSLLAKVRFTSAMPGELLSRLGASASTVHFPSGATIFRENSREDRLFLIIDGRVALDMNVPGQGPQRILVVGQGELLGWSPLLGRERMSAAATALEETDAVAISGRALREACEADPHFGFRLMQSVAEALAERLLMTRLQLLDLFADRPTAAGLEAPGRPATGNV